MAGYKGDYLEDKVLDHCVGRASFTMPTTYVALFTDSANLPEIAGGTLTNEVSTAGTAYARVATSGKWAAAGSGSITTNADIEFATATANWGTVSFFAIMDGDTEGSDNVLYCGDITTPKAVNTDDTAKFASGDITITES